MAAYPPPYPPPSGYSKRDQARLLREQTRMMRENARAQQRLYREQTRQLRRRSILGPILVLALGIVLLLGRLGHLAFDSLLAWYGRWWPLLLVVAGLILLAEWAWDERVARIAPPGTTRYARRGLGSGVILLLLLLAAAGSILRGNTRTGMAQINSFLSNPESWSEFLGERHEQEQSLDLDLPASSEFIVDNPHGDVILDGSSKDGRVHITAHKQVYSSSDSEAASRLQTISPDAQVVAGALHVSVPAQNGSNENLIISVPAMATSSITANHGDIRISGLNAPVRINANHGDVEVASIVSALNIRLNGHNSSFSARDIKGDLSLEGTGQDITVNDVSGTVTMDGDFYGDTHLERLSGPFRFHTSRTFVSFASLQGSFDISPHAELTGTGITGPTRVESYSRNITLNDLAGNIQVSNRNGTVDIQPEHLVGDIVVANRNGAITVTLPNPSAATLHAESRDGHIYDDFLPQPIKSGSLMTLDGKLGVGTIHVDLRTSNADIHIKKLDKVEGEAK